MYFYEGYSCPVCGQRFVETDDIVVCPQCGLPHHRACWSAEGHCHLQHLHNTNEQWSRDKENNKTNQTEQPPTHYANEQSLPYQICAQCHTRNPEFAEFCQHCGSPLKADDNWADDQPKTTHYSEYQPFRSTTNPVDPNEVIDDIKAADLYAFVGQKAEYYLPRFRRMAKNGKHSSWNWAAFFFGPLWLLYRKMYAYGAIVIILELLQAAVSEIAFSAIGFAMTDEMTYAEIYAAVEAALLIPENMYYLLAGWVLSAVLFIISIALGIYGNRLYFNHCGKTIARLREKTPDLTSGELSTSGGVSIAVAVIGYIAQYFLTQILFIFI